MLKFVRIATVTLIVAVSVALGTLAWILCTRAGTRLSWSLLQSQVPQIRAEQVSGSLWQGIEISKFRIHTVSETIEGDRLQLEIDFAGLLRGRALVDRIDLGEVRYRHSQESASDREGSGEFGTIPFLREIAVRQLSIQSLVYENTGWSALNTRGTARLQRSPEKNAWLLESRASTDFNIATIKGRIDLEIQGPLTLLRTSVKGESNAGSLDLRLQVADLLIRPAFDLEMNLKAIDPEILLDRDIGRYDLHLTAAGNTEKSEGNLVLNPLNPGAVQPFDRLAFLFSADTQQLRITGLSASIAQKSVVQGELQIKYAEWAKPSADLAITGLNLAGLRASLPNTDLQGRVILRPAAENAEVRFNISDPFLGTLNGLAGLSPRYADLAYLRFESPSGSAELSGRIAFSGDQAFTMNAKARHFKPGRIIKDLDGNLSFSVTAKGSIQPPALDTRLKFEPGSTLKSEALQGDLTFSLSRNGLARGTGGLSWGESRIALQSNDKTLNIRFNRINPRFLDDDLNAELSGNARLVFEPHAVELGLEASAPEIRYRDFLGRNLSAAVHGNTKEPEDLRIRLRIDRIDMNSGQARIEGLQLTGTPAAHRLTTRIVRGPSQATVAVSGAYASQTYRGTLNDLIIDTARNKQFGLAKAAPFEAGPGRIRLGPLVLKSLPATPGPEQLEAELTLDLDRFRFDTKGRFSEFPLEWIGGSGADPALRGTLSANWDLTYDNSPGPLSGRLTAKTSGLYLALPKSSFSPLTLENVSLMLAGHGRTLEFDLLAAQNAQNRLQTRLRAQELPGLRTLIEQGPRPENIRLDGQASLTLDDLSATGLIEPKLVVDSGRFDARARFSGNLNDPGIDGTARVSDFGCSVPDLGLKAKIPVAEARFDRRDVRLTRFDFATPNSSGSGHATAHLSLAPGQLGNFKLAFQGSSLQIIDQHAFKLTVSPDLQLSGTDDQLDVTGNIRVDKGLFADLSTHHGVSLSPDVVMAETETDAERPVSEAGGRGIHLEINVDIPDSFSVKAAGADLLLGGRLKVLQARAGIPIADGRLGVVDDKFTKNTYTAYGQVLRIKKGELLFARSPVNDPGLDILAVRKVKVGEVGVHVTGTAAAPQIQLQSEPAMADSEILSWLVLGRPSSEAGKGLGALLLAASGDVTGSDSLVNQTRDWLGLDELTFDSSEDTTSGIVTLGKRIGENLYLNYHQGILEQGYKIKAIYRLTPAWSLIAESARESNAVEIEWSKRF
ncbi:MAG: translocation/assembly module TamB domain-containing protein [Methylococcaceae bacterium]|nr:translocation/assembly module TamB domain-containing protein [Methylococcaceae bacterium]